MGHDFKWRHAEALKVAEGWRARLEPLCDRIEIAGSLRRRKDWVGDIELLYVSKHENAGTDFFQANMVSLVDLFLDVELKYGRLEKRPSKAGVTTWGPHNKLGVDTPSGIHMDFFATTEKKWWNGLVCRTGGLENNLLITTTARRLGWTFEAYGDGFTKLDGSEHYTTTSERDVYDFLKLPYAEPWERK